MFGLGVAMLSLVGLFILIGMGFSIYDEAQKNGWLDFIIVIFFTLLIVGLLVGGVLLVTSD